MSGPGREQAIDIDEDTIMRIRERVLEAEKEQLHLKRAHGIIPEIKRIVEEEVQ